MANGFKAFNKRPEAHRSKCKMSADNDDLQSLTVMKLLDEERVVADAYQVLIKSNTEGLCRVPTRKEVSP